MTYRKASNVLLEHVLGSKKPEAGETWRLRKGEREIIIDEVHEHYVYAHRRFTGRRTTIQLDTLLGRYVKTASGG